MKVDKILELSEKESFDLLKDIEQIFAFLMKMENLPDQLVAVIELGGEKEHAGEIAFISGCCAFYLSQIFFTLAVKVFRINGWREKSIYDFLSIVDVLEETDKG